jgi:hypothetical protein
VFSDNAERMKISPVDLYKMKTVLGVVRGMLIGFDGDDISLTVNVN